MEILTVLVALVAPITAIDGPVKHNGKVHIHLKRQAEPNFPAAGGGVLVSSIPASTNVAFNIPTISSYAFPMTVMQAPVATVCPDTPSASAIFPILPVPAMASMAGINSTHNKTGYLPVLVNATAFLPNGSSTVFLSASIPSILRATTSSVASNEVFAGETARIVLGRNGCQTMFSTITTTWCSTTIQPAGMLPVPITDCDQFVTFSSENLDGCGASSFHPTAGSGPAASGWVSPTVTGPVAIFAAHWYDLIQGPIPNLVQVQDCLPASTSLYCLTSSEIWTVEETMSTSTGMSVASFSGVCRS